MGGGQIAIRGLLVQTLIGLLEALDDDPPWKCVTLEPNVDSEKVDILWEYTDGSTKAVQVKSTENEFKKADLLKKYRLPAGDGDHRTMLAGALATKLATLSTKGKPLTRAALVKQLKQWIPQAAAATDTAPDPNTVRLIRVFVSSPGDAQEERKVLDEVVASINHTEEPTRGVRLELFKWEKNVVPKMGPRPQQVIEEQTPAYDIYLGVLKYRFGTPTETHGSGTEKEFHDALNRWDEAGWPWILFYFSESMADPYQLDLDQLAKVRAFRKQLDEKGQGLYGTYQGVRGSKDGFYEQVSEHLRKIVQTLPAISVDAAAASPGRKPSGRRRAGKQRSKPVLPADYLRWLQEECADVDLLGLRVQHGRSVKLNNVYVPLTMQAGEGPRRREPLARPDEERPVHPLLNLLEKDSLYVAGAPGSGKSTFCRWVAWLACAGEMPDAELPPPEKYQEVFPPSFAGRLPLLVRLRDFWSHLPQPPGGRELSARQVKATLTGWVNSKQPGGLSWSVVEPHLEQGSLLLILDGMDEVPLTHGRPKNSCQPRAMLLSGLAAALRPWIEQGNRILLTAADV